MDKSLVLASFFTIFWVMPGLLCQNLDFRIGLNVEPFYVLAGNYEIVGKAYLRDKLAIKLSGGYSYGKSFPAIRCLYEDNIEKKRQKGWFLKLNPSYKLKRLEKSDLYLGAIFLYSNFETQGQTTNLETMLKEKGDVFASGVTAGLEKKLREHFYIDYGLHVLLYNKELHQVGADCSGYIPGLGGTHHHPVFALLYIHLLFGK